MYSIKKHVRHMNKTERETLINMARRTTSWVSTAHSTKRLRQRGGTVEDVLDTLSNGNLIEYHRKGGSHRILIRGTKRYGNDVICAVFDLHHGNIITAFFNRHDDHHPTLNESAYNKDLDILKELGLLENVH